MASGKGMCVGGVSGAPCARRNGGPAPAVIVEDGRRMCADHRRGYRMLRTNAASAGPRERVLYAVVAKGRRYPPGLSVVVRRGRRRAGGSGP